MQMFNISALGREVPTEMLSECMPVTAKLVLCLNHGTILLLDAVEYA